MENRKMTAKGVETTEDVSLFDPYNRLLVILDKKCRNLEKRRSRLLVYKEEVNNGKELIKPQMQALEHISAIASQQEFLKELSKTISTMTLEFIRSKKQWVIENQKKVIFDFFTLHETAGLMQDAKYREAFEKYLNDSEKSKEALSSADECYNLFSSALNWNNRMGPMDLDEVAQQISSLLLGSKDRVPGKKSGSKLKHHLDIIRRSVCMNETERDVSGGQKHRKSMDILVEEVMEVVTVSPQIVSMSTVGDDKIVSTARQTYKKSIDAPAEVLLASPQVVSMSPVGNDKVQIVSTARQLYKKSIDAPGEVVLASPQVVSMSPVGNEKIVPTAGQNYRKSLDAPTEVLLASSQIVNMSPVGSEKIVFIEREMNGVICNGGIMEGMLPKDSVKGNLVHQAETRPTAAVSAQVSEDQVVLMRPVMHVMQVNGPPIEIQQSIIRQGSVLTNVQIGYPVPVSAVVDNMPMLNGIGMVDNDCFSSSGEWLPVASRRASKSIIKHRQEQAINNGVRHHDTMGGYPRRRFYRRRGYFKRPPPGNFVPTGYKLESHEGNNVNREVQKENNKENGEKQGTHKNGGAAESIDQSGVQKGNPENNMNSFKHVNINHRPPRRYNNQYQRHYRGSNNGYHNNQGGGDGYSGYRRGLDRQVGYHVREVPQRCGFQFASDHTQL